MRRNKSRLSGKIAETERGQEINAMASNAVPVPAYLVQTDSPPKLSKRRLRRIRRAVVRRHGPLPSQ